MLIFLLLFHFRIKMLALPRSSVKTRSPTGFASSILEASKHTVTSRAWASQTQAFVKSSSPGHCQDHLNGSHLPGIPPPAGPRHTALWWRAQAPGRPGTCISKKFPVLTDHCKNHPPGANLLDQSPCSAHSHAGLYHLGHSPALSGR